MLLALAYALLVALAVLCAGIVLAALLLPSMLLARWIFRREDDRPCMP